MRQSAALMGSGRGPRVSTGGATRLKIRGLVEGERAQVRHRLGLVETELDLANGEHPLGHSEDLEVEYSGRSREFLAVAFVED